MSSTIHSKAIVHVRQPSEFKAKAAYASKLAADKAGYQIKRSPLYLGRVLKYAGMGAITVTPPVFAFVFQTARHTDAKLVRQMGRGDKAAEIGKSAWYWTFAFSIGTAVTVTTALRLLYKHAGYAGLAGLGALLLLTLALIGSRLVGERVTDSAPPRRGDLSQQRIDDALRTIGILKTPKDEYDTKAGTSVLLHGMPYAKDAGVFCRFDLPAGAKATVHDVIKNRALLAGQLGVLERMLVVRQGDSEAQVELWVANEDPLQADVCVSPYVEAKRSNVWDGVRLGKDPMGQPVVIQLLRNSAGLGGLPQVGKSSVARVIVAAIALDPYADFVVFDGKGGTDWSPAKPLASRFLKGTSDRTVAEMLATSEDLVRQMDARYEVLDEVGIKGAPDGRITPELAESHDLRPCLVLVDELQDILGALGSKAPDFLEALTRLARRGPAAGISVLTISHRPDAKTVAKGLTGAQHIKIACRTDDRTASDLILGEGANAAGWNASRLPKIEGVGIVRTQEFTTEAKFDYVSLTDFVSICDRGMRLRAAAGTLREEQDLAASNILDAVILILSEHGDLTPTELAGKLGITTNQLAARLKPFGVSSHHDGTRRAYRLSDARKAFG